jgi:hypothetical protein
MPCVGSLYNDMAAMHRKTLCASPNARKFM